MLLVLALLIALGVRRRSARSSALRTGSGEAVQGFFPLFFVLLFLSSCAFRATLIEQDWFRTIATYNPVSYLIEGMRSLIIFGWDGQALALGFGFALGDRRARRRRLGLGALRTRLVRT